MSSSSSSLVLITPDGEETVTSRLVTLPHPRSGEAAWFLIRGDVLYELLRVDNSRSLMLPDSEHILGEPAICVVSVIDPVFMLIPHLDSQQCFLPLDDLPLPALPTSILEQSLLRICTVLPPSRGAPATYKLHPPTVLRLLKYKITNASKLPSQSPHSALSLVAEYLPTRWFNLVAADCNFPPEIPRAPPKRPSLDSGKPKKKQRVSVGVRSLTTVSTRGMQKMTGFFKKLDHP